MKDAILPNSERYEQALLTALDSLDRPVGAAHYRLLVDPTFHASGCVQVAVAGDQVTVRAAILPAGKYALAQSLWRGDAAAEETAILEAMLARVAETAVVASGPTLRLPDQWAALSAPVLAEEDVAGRDGVAVRLDAHHPPHQFVFRGQVGGLRASPVLRAWLTPFFALGEVHLQEARLRRWLSDLRSYFA